MNEYRGFVRPDGRVGARNRLVVLSPEGLSNRLAERIAGCVESATLIATPYGRGQLGRDRELTVRTLAGLGAHPNVGALLVVAYDLEFAEPILVTAADSGTPAAFLEVSRYGSTLTATVEGVRMATDLMIRASDQERVSVPLSTLNVALKCGLSDTTSGLVSNRVLGAVVDMVVDGGGTCIFGETAEITGAEHVLTRRAATPSVAEAILGAVRVREESALHRGTNLRHGVLGPENRRGGLTTLEEKALGNILKTGSRPIRGMLEYAQRPESPGLYMMDTPIFAPEAVTGMVAAGCNVVLFSTGAGNPFGHLLSPTLKVGANPAAHTQSWEHVDLDVSAVFRGEETLEQAAHQVLSALLRVASGRLTRAEVMKEGHLAIVREEPSS